MTRDLRDAILAGQFLPGERLVQEQLAEQFGVSRIPVREALRALEAEGLVTSERHSGYSVAKIDAAQLHSIQRIRQLLEAEAIRQTGRAGRLGKPLATELRALHALLLALPSEQAGEVAKVTRAFHFALFGACEDAVLLRILGNLWDATDSWRTIYYRLVFTSEPGHRQQTMAEHERLVDRIEAGDAEGAIAVLDGLRDRGIAAVEAVVATNRTDENRMQAHLMLRALKA